jgi:hypothetical protein
MLLLLLVVCSIIKISSNTTIEYEAAVDKKVRPKTRFKNELLVQHGNPYLPGKVRVQQALP